VPKVKTYSQKRNLEIYRLHLKKLTNGEIARRMNCSMKTVKGALDYYRKELVLPSKEEDLQDAINSVKQRLNELYARVEEIKKGIEETTTKESTDGFKQIVTTRKKPLTVEVGLYREIRQLENSLFSLQGVDDVAKNEKDDDKQVIIQFGEGQVE